MIQIDGKPLDMTKPETWGDAITINQGGSVTSQKDGVVTVVTQTQTDDKPELPCSH